LIVYFEYSYFWLLLTLFILKRVEQYVRALKEGDYAAFDALYHLYAENLFAFVISIAKDRYIAEEITQVVFIKVWEKRCEVKEHYSFKSWLFAITFNETVSYLRKVSAENTKIRKSRRIRDKISNETEYEIEFRNLESHTRKIIESLPEKRKQVFKMSREQGLSNQEISRDLGISVKTVENQMNSALKQIKKELGRRKILSIFFCLMYF